MPNVCSRLALLVVVGLFFAITATASTTTWSNISRAPVKTVTLTPGQPITIYLVNLGQSNAFSVEAVSGTTLTAQAWEVVYSGAAKTPEYLRLTSISKLANSCATWSSNTLTINGNVIADKRIAIRLKIPTGTTVTLYSNGKLIKNGTVNSNFLINSGNVVSGATVFDERAVIVTAAWENYVVCSS